MNPWVRHSFLRESCPEAPGSDDAPGLEQLSSVVHSSEGEEPSSAGLSPGAAARVGDEIAGFRVLEVLGQGAEGSVYLATQIELSDRPVVLKLSPLQGVEHRSLARLQHAHIVPILSAQDLPATGMRLLCLPYLGGTTLEHLLDELLDRPPGERTGVDLLEVLDRAAVVAPLTVEAAGPARDFLAVESYERAIVWIGLCLAEALHHAHIRNLVHWDVKPANILLAADGMPLLLDFHLAQPPLGITGPGPERLGGTPPYLAPEQFEALVAVTECRQPPAVDARADIYALAMVLYVALAGKPPPRQGRVADLMRRANPRVSPGLAAMIARGLEQDPRNRYVSAARFADDLRRHLHDEPLKGVANQSLPERWHKWRKHHPDVPARAGALLTALMALMVAGFFGWSAASRRLHDATAELERGQVHVRAGEHAQAARSFDRGLVYIDSAWRVERLMPQAQATRGQLLTARERNRRLEVAVRLHDLAERVRYLDAAGSITPRNARKLEARLEELWQSRDAIHRQLTNEGDSAALERLRADLLDLAILWANLRAEIAEASQRAAAHRDALLTLAQAEAEWGPSVVLSHERQFHAEAIGRTGNRPPLATRTEPGTAWECSALGRSMLRHGHLKEAAEALDRAVALQPQSLWAQFYRGQCALRRERFAEAVDAFGACVALSPEAVCYYNRSLAYAGLGASDRAERDLDRARQLEVALTASPPVASYPIIPRSRKTRPD